MKENSYMTKFINFKGMHRNAHEILSILTKLSCAVLVLTALGGCTVGMFGDMGGEAQAQIVGKTYSAVSPENVQIKDLIPAGGDSVSSATVSSYESTVKGEKVAQLMVKSTGYGDLLQKATDKLKDKAAKLGANLVLITSKNQSGGGGLGTVEGSNILTVMADAYHLQ